MSNPIPPDSPDPSTDHPVSGQPWSTPSGDPLAVEPYQPPQPPQVPTFRRGHAPLPGPPAEPDYPPTSQFPAQPPYAPPSGPPPGYAQLGYNQPGYNQPGYGPPGYGPPGQFPPQQPTPGYPPPPRRSNVPIIAVVVAVALLLCGGAVTAIVLVAHNVTQRAKDAVKPITDPTLPTRVPDIPGVPTALPTLPTDLPGIPGLPDSDKTITVKYEVTGDGPVEILYTTKLGQKPQRVEHAKLPWRLTTTMSGAALVSVTAAREDQSDGAVSCTATVDGDQVAQSTHQGPFAAVSCNKFVFN